MNCSGDVSESELANVVMEIQEVTSKMAPKSHAQPQEKRQPKFTSQQLHVVLVIEIDSQSKFVGFSLIQAFALRVCPTNYLTAFFPPSQQTNQIDSGKKMRHGH